MKKKAIILDLDNTIYPVNSIGDKLFKNLFELVENSGEFEGDIEEFKYEIMRTPFQKVAKDFSFSKRLFEESMLYLKNLTYNEPIASFEDYEEVRNIKLKKYLVTVGFKKLQQSKVRQLNLEQDFESIFIIDPEESGLTKKDVFQDILTSNAFLKEEMIIVGDDLRSEIKAGKDLEIDTVVYDREGKYANEKDIIAIRSFKELNVFLY